MVIVTGLLDGDAGVLHVENEPLLSYAHSNFVTRSLGVSVKSVEWHVSHILRKLSITSRTEMAGALAQPRQGR